MSSAGLIFLKLGGQDGAPVSIVNGKIEFNLGIYAISGIILYAISFVIYTYLVSKNDLGYIIPVSTALVYIFIFAASYFIFKEAITAMKIVGIFLILGGVILLNLSK
jgi:drug/metabolite transporter (DMT)-like permease